MSAIPISTELKIAIDNWFFEQSDFLNPNTNQGFGEQEETAIQLSEAYLRCISNSNRNTVNMEFKRIINDISTPIPKLNELCNTLKNTVGKFTTANMAARKISKCYAQREDYVSKEELRRLKEFLNYRDP